MAEARASGSWNDVAEAVGQRLEGLVLLGLAGGVQGGEGAAVERSVRADDDVATAAAPLAGQLDGALVGLGAAVAEEDPPRPGVDEPVKSGRHVGADLVTKQIRDVQQGLGLGIQGVGHSWVGMTERRDGQPGQEVQVLLPLVVPESTPLAPHERHGGRGISGHEGHGALTIVPTPWRVKILSSRACSWRPSRMWAWATPPSTARTHDATLGIMPPAMAPDSHQRFELGRGGSGDPGVGIGLVAADPVDVGQVDEFDRLHRGRDGAGRGIGVDVVRLPLRVAADGGDDRDQVLRQQPVDEIGVDGHHVADETELRIAGLGADQSGVLAGETDGERGVYVDGGDDVPIDLADEDHPSDVEGFGIGHP